MFSDGKSVASPVVLCEDGQIVASGSRDAVAIPAGAKVTHFEDAVLVPGYVDLHIHGAMGCDVMVPGDNGLERMARFLAEHGVTAFLPTTVTAATDILIDAVSRIAEKIENWSPALPSARPVGIHLEGPCINKEKRGVHPIDDIKNPSIELFDRLYNAGRGWVKLITVAPELPGAIELIEEATRRGVRVSIGHTNGMAEDAEKAIRAGAVHATHTFNAMRPLDHRTPGVLGKVLESDELFAEIIADGVHVDPILVDLFLRCKGKDRAVLVTDSTSATGMPDGKYRLGSFEVTVQGLRCEADGRLAGSVLTLDRAVRNVMKFAAWPLADSAKLASENPARVVGESALGSLRKGARADVAVLSRSGEVVGAFVGGEAVR
jgi:N-acetylglucosamine-6-phosphate deacetylase